MLDIPSISAVVAAVGVLVGVTLAYLEEIGTCVSIYPLFFILN